jgi:hypothetical protein
VLKNVSQKKKKKCCDFFSFFFFFVVMHLKRNNNKKTATATQPLPPTLPVPDPDVPAAERRGPGCTYAFLIIKHVKKLHFY